MLRLFGCFSCARDEVVNYPLPPSSSSPPVPNSVTASPLTRVSESSPPLHQFSSAISQPPSLQAPPSEPNEYFSQKELTQIKVSAAVRYAITNNIPPEKRGKALQKYDRDLLAHTRRGAVDFGNQRSTINAFIEQGLLLPGAVPSSTDTPSSITPIRTKRDTLVPPLSLHRVHSSLSSSPSQTSVAPTLYEKPTFSRSPTVTHITSTQNAAE